MSRPDEGDDGRTVEVEYIQRVKGSLNRLLNASLSDDGKAVLENRSWPFPLMYNLAVIARVDRPTKDALIRANKSTRPASAGYS